MPKVNITIDDKIKTTYKEMEKNKHRYLIAQIDKDGENFNLLKVGDIDATLNDFKAELQSDQCAIGLFKFEYDVKINENIEKRSKFIIISWIPLKSNVKSRMLHGNGPSYIKQVCDGVTIIVQADSLEQITETELNDKAQKFNRF